MRGWDDYYRILQVHYLAEPEVIASAYKRLAKKYHPDVNGSDIKMKQINEAYGILKDKEKRKKYDADWLKKQDNAINEKSNPKNEIDTESVILAKAILGRYFAYIKNKNFEKAYELLSNMDKKKIQVEDFFKWQSAVSKIFYLQDFNYKATTTDKNIKISNLFYKQIVSFTVITIEHNIVMNRLEKDIINKTVVLEKEGWRIYLGYEDVQPLIAKFEELTGLLVAKSLINEMVEAYSNVDNLTGFNNKKGFIEAAEKEVWRYFRYGNTFSLMLLEIGFNKSAACNIGQEFKYSSIGWAGKILKDSFRKLDLIGRWEETRFIVLMPETDLAGSIKAALKIKGHFDKEKLLFHGEKYKAIINIGVDECTDSLESTIERLHHSIGVAKKLGDSNIIHSSDIYTNSLYSTHRK